MEVLYSVFLEHCMAEGWTQDKVERFQVFCEKINKEEGKLKGFVFSQNGQRKRMLNSPVYLVQEFEKQEAESSKNGAQ